MSGVLSGQPITENGQSCDENQVSSTSGSCVNFFEPQVAQTAGSSSETVRWPFSQVNAGIRWPHQSCREMHQSWMFSIHAKYVFAHDSGTKRISPFSTARIAGSARGAIFTNHCSERYGSMTVSHLWQ